MEDNTQQLNPLQNAVLKRVQKNTEMQVDEAMQQGVPATTILEQIGIPSVMGDARQQQNQQPQQQPQQKQPVQQQQIQQPNLQAQQGTAQAQRQPQDQGQNVFQQLIQGLSQGQLPTFSKEGFTIEDFLVGIAEGYSGGFAERVESQKLKRQQRLGEIPLQKAELQKAFLESGKLNKKENAKLMNTFFTNTLSPKPLAAETSKVLGFVDDSIDALTEINKIFQADPKLLRNLSVPGNPLGQKLKFLKDLAGNSLLRKESGAAITEEERKFFNKLLSPVGARAFFEDPSTIKLKLDTILRNLGRQKRYLQPNEGLKERIQSAIQSGFSREEIFQKLREKGEI